MTMPITRSAPLPARNPWFQRLLALLLAAVALYAALRPQMDAFAEEQVEAGLKRALVAFALARALNGVISVAQSTEVSLQPAGIGVGLSPGEILDPVNDLVEQFSTVMLVASASLGLQRILIGISAWMPLQIVLCAMILLWLVATFATVPRVQRLLRNTALMLVLLRFAVPVSALLSEGAYRLFLHDEYQQSSAAIEQIKEKIMLEAEAAKPQPTADASIIERAQQWIDDKAKAFDVAQRLEQLEQTATEVTGHVINLIAVFLIQTVVLPLLLLWIGWRALLVVVPRALGPN